MVINSLIEVLKFCMLKPIACSVKSQMEKIQDKPYLLMNHDIAGLSIENPQNRMANVLLDPC